MELGAARGMRERCGKVKGGKGNKMEGESCWKSGGGRVRLYTWRRTGLADEVRSDAIPDAAGGEGGHGAAKPDGVIHRYRNYRLYIRLAMSSILVCTVLFSAPS